MKHTTKQLSDTKVQLTITLSSTELNDIKKNTIARLAQKVKVAGFRKGKVPAGVAEKNLDPNYLNTELLEDAVNASAIEAFEIAKLTPLDRPKVDIVKFVPGQELEYTAEVEIIPGIKLGDYKKLKAVKEKVVVSDEEINQIIERLRGNSAQKQQVDRAAKKGDQTIIDFDGKDKDGKSVAGASGKDYELVLGSGTFIPGFEDGIIGKKAGDTFDLALTFPKDYHHKPLAGAKVVFAVNLKQVKEVKLPELNDEFAKNSGPFKDMAELKADIKKELLQQKEQEANDKLKDSLVEQLVKVSNVPVPQILVNDQLEGIKRDFQQNLMYRGMTIDAYLDQLGKTQEEWEKDLQKQAERRVQVGLVLSELSKVEKIEVKQQDLEARLQQMMQEYGNAPEIAKQLDSPEARRDIANRVITEKTVDKLVELNTK